MAFSKQPEISTYQTKKVPLAYSYSNRDSFLVKDVDYVNVYFEVTKNKESKEEYVDIYTRPGYTTWSSTLQSTNVRKVYYWEGRNKWYVWVDDDLQIINGDSGTIDTTLTAVLSTSSGAVGVTEFLYDTGEVKLVFTDGTDLCTIDSSNTVVTSADADIPAAILTTIVFLDGYLFVVDAATQDIVNSNLNDPLAFTAGDYISAEMNPDTMVAIARINNYLLAFGKDTIEYFWNAANASGSPMQRNDTPVKFNGLLSANSLAIHGNKLFFLGNNEENAPSIFMLEDFKIKELGNISLRKQLRSNGTFADIYGNIVSANGHEFYVLSGTLTFIIDINSSEMWTRWAKAGSSNLPIKFCTNANRSAINQTIFYQSGAQVLHIFDNTVTTDAGTSYTWAIVTPNEDFDSYNQKNINRLTVVGDRPSADTTISISWTDNDYQSYQTAQTVNLNQELPCIYQCGSFRRRAHKLTATPTVPFRVRHLEVDINLGNS